MQHPITKANIRVFGGDKILWSVFFIMCAFSVVVIYSGIAALAYKSGEGTLSFLFKQVFFLAAGFVIVVGFQTVKWFNKTWPRWVALSVLAVSIILLFFTLYLGESRNEAVRWIRFDLGFFSFTIQSSDVARVCLLLFMADFLARKSDQLLDFKAVFMPLMIAIGLVCLPIFIANFSTSALVFLVAWLLMMIVGVNWKYLMLTLIAILGLGIGLYFAGEMFPSVGRLGEIHSRVDAFLGLSKEDVDTFQADQAKIAIVRGGWFGVGPGKSIQRNIMPNPFSDFAFALIVEEYGVVFGATPILALFLFFLFRSVRIARFAPNRFASIVVIALALNLVLQALTNICVSVGLFPVTGQNLPIISKGGTSIIIAAIQIGIILNVSRNSINEPEPGNKGAE